MPRFRGWINEGGMEMSTPVRTLEDLVNSVSSVTEYLYNNQTGARVYPVVLPEYTK